MIPLSVIEFFNQHYVLCAVYLLFTFITTLYLYYSINQRVPPVSFDLGVFVMCLSQILDGYYSGISSVFWIYPLVTSFYFVLTPTKAHVFSALMLIPYTIFFYQSTNIDLTARFIGSIVVTYAIIRLIINHVNSLSTELHTLSTLDPLTGAYNRRHMEQCLQTVAQSENANAILIIDIDHFKQVNDNFGHDVGDLVLKALVQCLQLHARDNDIVFRMGGEEFMMLLPATSIIQAKSFAQQLRKHIALITIGTTEQTITASIGISEIGQHGCIKSALKSADTCLYQAKEMGRNCVIA